MNVTVDATHLQNALGYAARVKLPKSSWHKILSNVLFVPNAENGTLTIYKANLESTMAVTIPADVIDDAPVTVNASVITDFVKLQDDVVKMELKGKKLVIRSGKSTAKLPTDPVDEFPIGMWDIIGDKGFDVFSAEQLKRAIRLTEFSASDNRDRIQLTGVYFVVENGKAEMAATDGYRLSVARFNTTHHDIKALIPIDSIRLLLSIIGDEDVLCKCDETKIIFKIGNVMLRSQLIAANYISYRQIIPSSEEKIVVSAPDLLNALRRAAVFSREDQDVISLDVYSNFDSAELEIKAIAAETGDMVTVMSPTSTDDLSINLNTLYLNQVLLAAKADRIEIGFSKVGLPITIRIVDDDTFVHVTSPIVRRK